MYCYFKKKRGSYYFALTQHTPDFKFKVLTRDSKIACEFSDIDTVFTNLHFNILLLIREKHEI